MEMTGKYIIDLSFVPCMLFHIVKVTHLLIINAISQNLLYKRDQKNIHNNFNYNIVSENIVRSKLILYIQIISTDVATPCYPNSTIPRGYCIIIDNYSEAEDGSEDCIQNLKCLGFHVERFNQLNVNSIRMLLQFVSKLDHSNYSSLMVIARGRGEGGVMYGNDNKKIALGEFVTYFSTEDCSSLQHKPKLFLFQTYGAPRQSSNENMSHVNELADSFQVVYKSPTSTEGIYTFIRKVVDDNGETSVNDIIIQNASQMAYHYKPETLLYYHQQNTNSTM